MSINNQRHSMAETINQLSISDKIDPKGFKDELDNQIHSMAKTTTQLSVSDKIDPKGFKDGH
jgi:hypothetical protein